MSSLCYYLITLSSCNSSSHDAFRHTFKERLCRNSFKINHFYRELLSRRDDRQNCWMIVEKSYISLNFLITSVSNQLVFQLTKLFSRMLHTRSMLHEEKDNFTLLHQSYVPSWRVGVRRIFFCNLMKLRSVRSGNLEKGLLTDAFWGEQKMLLNKWVRRRDVTKQLRSISSIV